MAKMKITNDMEYWQLKEEHARSLLASRNETDKKKKKELEKEVNLEHKMLASYEKSKIKRAKEQQKVEDKLRKSRNKTEVEEKIFFEVSPIEAKYINYTSLQKNERNKLAVKKESLISSINKGMYIKLRGDSGLYQVKQSEKKMNGLKYVSSVVYGNVAIQDVALIIASYYYRKRIKCLWTYC